MATYIELKQRAEKLMEEAEEMRKQELSDVIADIKNKIAEYGLTVSDLGMTSMRFPRGSVKKASNYKSTAVAKYRGPKGESWSGGRGRKPQWVVEALKSGKRLEDFAI